MLLKDTWPEKGLLGKVGRELNMIARLLNGCRGFGGIQIHKTAVGLHVYGGAAAVTADQGLWQPVSIDNDVGTITIGRGIFVDGANDFQVPETEVMVSGGTLDQPAYVYIEYPYAGGEPEIRPEASHTFPASDIDYFRRPLVEVYLDQDQINVKERLWTQIIDITQLMSRF